MAADLAKLRIKDDHLRRVLKGEAFLVEDGGMGTMLQATGALGAGEAPDLLNLTNPQVIVDIQRAYVEAGAQLVSTNTFGANALKLEGRATVAEVFQAAANNARAAGARYVAGDIGPVGALLEPLGTLSFDAAYDLFAEQVRAADAAGCDVIVVETMADLREAKAAVLAATENCDLPVFVTMTFGEDGRTFLGTTPAVAAAAISAMDVAAVGVNCSLGPAELAGAVREVARFARCPVVAKPNAGLPHLVDGETRYDVAPADFARAMEQLIEAGASIVGGCCGTTPEFIAELARMLEGRAPAPRAPEDAFVVTSAQEAVVLPAGVARVAVIGERINPTGKKKLKAALREGNYDYVVGEAVAQQRAGASILDVNAGLPDIDEARVLREVVETLQSTVTLPLQIDSSDAAAVEATVRVYAGKPLINSVNGKRESLKAVLPVAKRYGCAVVGLTLDEGGIPPTAEGRLAVAERIVRAAEAAGIPRSDVAIDCLVMAAATNQAEIREVLRAVALCKERLGVRTVLGVSNVSFGMPQRNLLNATFLAAAFGAGLDMPILNPLSARYCDAVAAFRVLNGQDAGAAAFVERYANSSDHYDVAEAASARASATDAAALRSEASQPSLRTAASAALGDAGSALSVVGDGSSGASLTSAALGKGERSGLGVGADLRPVPVTPAFSDAPELVARAAQLVLEGRAAPMGEAVRALLEGHEALDVINGVLIPALDVVGERYDAGAFFLPQLMASAEAAKAGFDVLREHTLAGAAAGD
ncbi:MAG: homocysteine S-methyltransferase family protein, partial [Eggerthellaceae bacterium]|nr:homocysteine S-methyltransferase family protein [Eggerthellaceae bacterium]